MCMLSYLPPGHDVDEDGLLNGGISNPHGSGWAIAHKEMIIMGRDLKVEVALESFIKARRKYDGAALFHSRLATHGSVSVSNVHPFIVGGSHKTVVAHNGILTKPEAQPLKGDDRSDTRKFADEVLPGRFANLDKISVQKELTKWCGLGNKLAILTVDPRYQSSAYLINASLGEWDQETGLWHSNSDYREALPRWLRNQSKSKATVSARNGVHVYDSATKTWIKQEDGMMGANVAKSAEESAEVFIGSSADELDWRCAFCGMGEVNKMGYCKFCETCQDCGKLQNDDCDCWERAYEAMKAAHSVELPA
jgi:hypothetical protein